MNAVRTAPPRALLALLSLGVGLSACSSGKGGDDTGRPAVAERAAGDRTPRTARSNPAHANQGRPDDRHPGHIHPERGR